MRKPLASCAKTVRREASFQALYSLDAVAIGFGALCARTGLLHHPLMGGVPNNSLNFHYGQGAQAGPKMTA